MPDENHPLPPPDPVIYVQPQDYQTEVKDFSSRQPAFRTSIRPARSKVPLILFVVTCLSTFIVGATGNNPFVPVPREFARLYEFIQQIGWTSFLVNGISYAGPLMLILLSHEMGHYLQSRRYHIPATRPLFIPMPLTPFGTMGAVILQRGGMADRKQMFDIAVTGPLAGLVFALPIAYWGVLNSTVAVTLKQPGSISYGEPLILQWMISMVHGPLAANQEVILNPLLFAGWVGIFITALNLLPIGQLDGGHILYTLLGKKANLVSRLLMAAAVGYMFYTGEFGYSLLILLLVFFGINHPPTANDRVPLGTPRLIIGWLTLAFFIIGFTITPVIIY
ncbi:MAG: site-2 protease family protein [Gimesia sp.]|uniref:site-2 protease family protein n=2 Tax=Gimesia TaxID=1649453 RepID=UPI000C3A501A|nr:site-2 protease family protein [Gimesia sp.]MAX38031.1 site-2 protease family protein [Gimesia sp.]|tara:strand:- start:47946 stop:48950 length:1005 start_codon:yes stop_codon:yes gene_type:complete